MKKLLVVLAFGAFVSCNNAGESTDAVDSVELKAKQDSIEAARQDSINAAMDTMNNSTDTSGVKTDTSGTN